MITRFYSYTLTLHAPLLLPKLGGDPNSVQSLDFIPGSTIRGSIASRLTSEELFQMYILSGQVCYLNAYPVVEDTRTLPTPVSFRQEKHGDQIFDLAFYPGFPDKELEQAWPSEQLSGIKESFLSLDRADYIAAEVTLESRVHQQRDRKMGRARSSSGRDQPREAHGTIFTYEALEAGQDFQGIIAISGRSEKDTNDIWQKIQEIWGPRVSLGRSRNARYGGAVTVCYEKFSREHETAGASGIVRNEDQEAGSLFCVYLTSDYIGRDPVSGQIDPTAFVTELTGYLGEESVEILRTRWAFGIIGGFNRKWGLQLPQSMVLRAGSLLVLKSKAVIPYVDLLAIEKTGLGERRPEGFGRIIFLEQPTKTCVIYNEIQSDVPIPSNLAVPPLVEKMQKRILTDALEHRISIEAADLARQAKKIPSISLLGHLRAPLRGYSRKGLVTLKQWLTKNGQHALKRTAMNQLDACRLDQTSLAQWIQARINSRDVIADLHQGLQLQRVFASFYIQSSDAAERLLKEDLDLLALFQTRWIDEVLALLARRKRLTKG